MTEKKKSTLFVNIKFLILLAVIVFGAVHVIFYFAR
jgi:hypothetical protein